MNSFRPAASLLVCMGMIACASQEKPARRAHPPAEDLKAWYVASQEPLTFCPRGYSPPPAQSCLAEGAYVYLADRKTRFYIPAGSDTLAYRHRALATREASFSDSERFTRSVSSKIAWVGNTVGQLALVTLVGFGEAAAANGGFGGMNRCRR